MRYIDELIQIATNDDPTDEGEDDCETTYYAMQDANYNVLGIVEDDGTLVERYEYTPYGQRTIFKSAGADDPNCFAPILESQRVQISGEDAPYGLCEVGHQGLSHEKETGDKLNNRARPLDPILARFDQPDYWREYIDGMNRLEAVKSNPIKYQDWLGLEKEENASTKEGECYCGPDMTGFLVKLINHTTKWHRTQVPFSHIIHGLPWLRNHGIKLDWSNDKGMHYKTDKCPSGRQCRNTYWLCGECVHDHWIGNFMYGFIARLLGTSDWVANTGAQWIQQDGDDPPWDKAGYDLGRLIHDKLLTFVYLT
jgi:RHS repeat-associated protein